MIETLPVPEITEAPVPETLRIIITKEDAINGSRGNAFSCPIALAAKRALKEWGGQVSVAGMVTLRFNGTIYGWKLSDTLAWSMTRFDQGGYFYAVGVHDLSLYPSPLIIEK
jgi:hypothetical protein